MMMAMEQNKNQSRILVSLSFEPMLHQKLILHINDSWSKVSEEKMHNKCVGGCLHAWVGACVYAGACVLAC